jgi:RNA-binding protein
MNPLTSTERRALRAKAHALKPVVAIGQHGLTPAVLHEIDVALLAHELIKIRAFSDDRAERELLYARICAELDAAPVQHIGKLLVVWRLAPEPEPEPVAARPAPRKTVKGAKPGMRAPRGNAKPDARTPRGQPKATPRTPRGKSAPHATAAGGRRHDPFAGPTGAPTRRRRGAAQDRPAPAAAGSRPPRRRRTS